MKTLAIVGASYLQRPLVEKAKEMGLRTICFAWALGEVCSDIADHFYPISITEREKILGICRKETISGICTIASDVAAPTVAYVAERMGLTGNSYEASVRANDKFLMRKAFSSVGIKCPFFFFARSSEDIKGRQLRFPLIVKPCDRSGSLGVRKVNSEKELRGGLEYALECSFKSEAIIEEYIEGREVSVEFISHRGHHYPLTVTDKVTTGSPHFVELEHHQPANLSPEVYDRLYATTKQALDALGITDGASHTEFRITGNDEIFIIELGARMGGDFIGSDLVRLSTGYDFVKGVIQVALGEFTIPEFSKRSCSGVYFLCKETERLLPVFNGVTRPPFIFEMEKTGDELKEVACSADRSGYLIYQADKRIVL